jgi:RNA polymerase sigma-70 factor, ECF subfamily
MNTPWAEQSERDLVASVLKGRRDGFAELVRRHMTSLQHFLRRHNTEADVDDLVQETFFRAYRSLDRFDPQWRFSTWLFTIARRLSLDELRRRNRSGERTNWTSPSAGADGHGSYETVDARQLRPDVIAESRERKTNIWSTAKSVLSEEEWTTLWLFYVEGSSVKEIAFIQEKNTPAVKTMLHRARKRLAPFLDQDEGSSSQMERDDKTSSQGAEKRRADKTMKAARKANDGQTTRPQLGRDFNGGSLCEGKAT